MRHVTILVGVLAVLLVTLPARADDAEQDRLPDYIDDNGIPVYIDEPVEPTSGVDPAAAATPTGRYVYYGSHPIPAQWGGGFDVTPGRHAHDYPPFDPYLFVERDGAYYFVGDPRDFGYTGEAYAYNGAHPITYVHGGGFCYFPGTHFHLWAPIGPYFSLSAGWWGWTGPYPYWFWWYYPAYRHYHAHYYHRYYRGGRYVHSGRRRHVATPPPPPRARTTSRGSKTVQSFRPGRRIPARPANIPKRHRYQPGLRNRATRLGDRRSAPILRVPSGRRPTARPNQAPGRRITTPGRVGPRSAAPKHRSGPTSVPRRVPRAVPRAPAPGYQRGTPKPAPRRETPPPRSRGKDDVDRHPAGPASRPSSAPGRVHRAPHTPSRSPARKRRR